MTILKWYYDGQINVQINTCLIHTITALDNLINMLGLGGFA